MLSNLGNWGMATEDGPWLAEWSVSSGSTSDSPRENSYARPSESSQSPSSPGSRRDVTREDFPYSRRAADVRVDLPRLLAGRPAGRGSLSHRLLARSGLLSHRLLAGSGLLGHANP